MAKTVSRKPARGRPRSLDRADIVGCALAVLDRDGVNALTLRGVARELGIALGTLNNYFSSLAALEDAVAAQLMAQMPVLDAKSRQPLRDQLVDMGMELINAHSLHPYLRHITGRESVIIGTQWVLSCRAALVARGLSGNDAALCLEMVQSIAYGRGVELHRLRNRDPVVMEQIMAYLRKTGTPTARLKAADFTPEKMAPANRISLQRAMEVLLGGFARQQKKSPAARRKSHA